MIAFVGRNDAQEFLLCGLSDVCEFAFGTEFGTFRLPQGWFIAFGQTTEETMGSQALATLKNLAEVSRDGEKGFIAAAEGVKDESLKSTFQRAAARCATGARELTTKSLSSGACQVKPGPSRARASRVDELEGSHYGWKRSGRPVGMRTWRRRCQSGV